MNDPPLFRLTQHALDQARAMGVTPDEVRACIRNPLVDIPSDTKPACRLAHDGRIKAVYNPDQGLVITVLWVSHEWLPDRHLPPELQPMSGWINLDAKQAEKLLAEWGFQVVENKGLTNLWSHPDDLEKRKVPFAVPARGSKANGKGSFRVVAQIVGVPVARFVQGRDDEALEALRRKRQLAEVRDATALMGAPSDPLGVNRRLASQTVDRVKSELLTPLPPATAPEEPPMPTMTVNDEKVLAALVEQPSPITSNDIASATGITNAKVREALRKLEKEELAYRVGFAPSRGGAPGALWWHEETYNEPSPTPEPDHQEDQPMPATAPAPSIETSAVIAGHIGAPATSPSPRIFTETGTPWPTGGLLIQDEDGVFYVARKLIEEGR